MIFDLNFRKAELLHLYRVKVSLQEGSNRLLEASDNRIFTQQHRVKVLQLPS